MDSVENFKLTGDYEQFKKFAQKEKISSKTEKMKTLCERYPDITDN